jgi:5-methyltetrahydropteroyltriglutamate--homocysteine methyltransferase
LNNEYYKTDEELMFALADALHVEYTAIAASGLYLQVDDAVLVHEYDSILSLGGSVADYQRWAQLRIDALKHALRGIPPERVRYHVCWGSWHGPHAFDPPLAEVVNLVLQVPARYYLIEQANPRHEHEWKLWETVKLPDDKVLVPGVVTHHTNVVEHPELVAQRLTRLARVVGRERVMGGTDCGFAQGAFIRRVHPSIQWAKLQALAQGAALATRELWRA